MSAAIVRTLGAVALIMAAAAAGTGCGGQTGAASTTATQTVPSAAMLSGPILPVDCTGVYKSRPQCEALSHAKVPTGLTCVLVGRPQPAHIDGPGDPNWRPPIPRQGQDKRACPPGTKPLKPGRNGG